MAQRNSEYGRIENDTYVTPKWVWNVLYNFEPWAREAVDICPVNYVVSCFDLLADSHANNTYHPNVACNPPYGSLGPKIVRYTLPVVRRAAFLFPATWDCAKGRADLFQSPMFKVKYVLTERITWANLDSKATPSTNHAWYVWDLGHIGPPQMRVI